MKIYGAYNYTPYGTFMGGIVEYKKIKNELNNLYTEQEYIREFSIYNYNARFYDDSIGRFYSKDIENEFPSPYVYAGNNSICLTDPSGKSVLGGILSTVLGIGAIALGILLAPETAGMSLNLSTLGSLALSGGLIGAGISSGVYGASHMNDSFDWADWGVESAIGLGAGAIANMGFAMGITAISSLKSTNIINKIVYNGLLGSAVGGTIGLVGNGVSNYYYSKEFMSQWNISVSLGSAVGFVLGVASTVRIFNTSRGKIKTPESIKTASLFEYSDLTDTNLTTISSKKASVNIINPSKEIKYDLTPIFIGNKLYI